MKERLKKVAAFVAAHKVASILVGVAVILLIANVAIWFYGNAEALLRFFLVEIPVQVATVLAISGWGFWAIYGRESFQGPYTVFKVVMLAYLEVKEKESKEQAANKATKTVAKWLVYWLSDWGVEIGMVSMIGALKYHNFTWNEIFLASWVVDILVALTFVFISSKIIDDFMLMRAYRRAVNALYWINKQAGVIFLALSLVKFSLWDGSEVATMFFERELNTMAKKVLAVMLFSLLRILLLVKVFSLGYDFLS